MTRSHSHLGTSDRESRTMEVIHSYDTVHLQMFSWRTTRPLARNASRKYWTRESPDGQNVLLSSLSDGLIQHCMTFSPWFSHKTAAFYTERYTSPSLFHIFEVSRGSSNRSLTMAHFQTDLCACAQTLELWTYTSENVHVLNSMNSDLSRVVF